MNVLSFVAKLLTQEFPISEEVDLSDMSYDESKYYCTFIEWNLLIWPS